MRSTGFLAPSHAVSIPYLRLLFLLLLWPYALGQGSISLNSSRSGTLAADELYHTYTLELPAGLSEVTIWVDGGGLDIDLSVNYGAEIAGYSEGDADFVDTSLDVYPFYTIAFPRNGRYYIDVVNLISTAIPYTLYVTTDASALHAVRANSCRWAHDGECDEPGLGSGVCAAGTDAYDCRQQDAPPVEEVIRAAPSVTVQPLVVQPGATVTVFYTGAPGNARDWIGLYRAGGGDREFLAYQYLGANRSGSLSFTAPQEVGQYDVRMFENDGYTRLAVSSALEVAALASPPAPPSSGSDVGQGAVAIPCEQQANQPPLVELAVGRSLIVSCPACPAAGRLWGTGTYTDDSWVCLAAMHSGVTGASGGSFELSILEGQASYPASTQNGVASSSWGSWSRSFRVSSLHVSAPPADPPVGSGTLSVRSDEAATLESTLGVRIEVPAGAVPLGADGRPGTMDFSIESAPGVSVTLPDTFRLAGEVYQLGPEGVRLEQPVQVTLPLEAGVAPNSVYGVTTYDAAEGRWLVIPGTVDAAARTVTFLTDHLSPWAPVGFADPAWSRTRGGWLNISNQEQRGVTNPYRCSPDDAGCTPNMPSSHGYGICLISWSLENPQLRFWSETDLVSRRMVALDAQTLPVWLPSGLYTIEEFYHVSQINSSPGYVPRHAMYLRPQRTLLVSAGQVTELGSSLARYPEGYSEGWSVCYGGSGVGSSRERSVAVGTGDVQVTLTWQASVDLDLYVTDPSGDTVYYGNPRVPSGGELDRDNRCSNFETGRPENIFWPPGTAPAGDYRVLIDYYGSCESSQSVSWTVRVSAGGSATTYQGTLEPDEEREVATFRLGSTGTAPSPGCWTSYTNDQRQFGAQPFSLFPHATLTVPGRYVVHIGAAGENGVTPPDSWQTYGPYLVRLGHLYEAVMQTRSLTWQEDSAATSAFGATPDRATIYTRNGNVDAWWAMCVERVGD